MKQFLRMCFIFHAFSLNLYAQNDFSSLLIHKHKAEVYTLACSPDGEWVASGGSDKVIMLSHIEQKKHQKRLVEHHKMITSLTFDPTGKFLASTGSDGKLCIWNAEQGKLTATLYNERGDENALNVALHFAFFHENYVYFGGDGAVLMRADYTLPKPKTENVFIVPDRFFFKTMRSGVVSPDKQYFFLASGTEIYKVKIADAELAGVFKHNQEINHLNFTPNGKFLCSWHYDGKMAFWNPILGRTEKHIQVAKQHHYGEVRFSPNGHYFITGNSDNICKIWDFNEGQVCGVLAGHQKPVRTYTYTPDGERIVTGGYDGELRIWKKMYKTTDELVAFEEVDINASENSELKKGTLIKLPRLVFEQNNEKLLFSSNKDLEQLYLLLLKYPNLVIELCGHSDSAAESVHGLKLSERRAEAVKKYLTERGIPAFRLIIKALGGSKPIYTAQKELRKYNRRVDAVVVEK